MSHIAHPNDSFDRVMSHGVLLAAVYRRVTSHIHEWVTPHI